MWNLLSHMGVNLQAELCAWSILGVVRSTFDATLFHINANLKRVWSAKMPSEISLSAQRILRTMISGVVLVQVFTVHLYLAAYIILLYPVFLEERPALVLPWLLVSAVRGVLCELAGLALGLTSCLLVGATRSPCVVFVLGKLVNIVPAVYMWILVFNYYQSLKMMTSFRTFATESSGCALDGLELAVRRRRTKSLFAEATLRKNLINCSQYHRIFPIPLQPPDHLKSARTFPCDSLMRRDSLIMRYVLQKSATMESLPCASEESSTELDAFDEWLNFDLPSRRNVDRILDQFVKMILKVSAYMSGNKSTAVVSLSEICLAVSRTSDPKPPKRCNDVDLRRMELDTPTNIGGSVRAQPSYIRNYPKIFDKEKEDTTLIGSLNPLILGAALLREDAVQTDSLLTCSTSTTDKFDDDNTKEKTKDKNT